MIVAIYSILTSMIGNAKKSQPKQSINNNSYSQLYIIFIFSFIVVIDFLPHNVLHLIIETYKDYFYFPYILPPYSDFLTYKSTVSNFLFVGIFHTAITHVMSGITVIKNYHINF